MSANTSGLSGSHPAGVPTETSARRMVTSGLRRALPLICGLLIWLWLAPDPWPVNPFPYAWPRNPYPWWVRWALGLLAILVVWAAGSEHPALRTIRSRIEQRAMVLLLIGLSLAFVYGWATSLVPLYTFDSRGPGPSLDLALYSSVCWNTWEGRPFQSIWGHYFAIHASFVPVMLLPLCPPGIGIAGYLVGHSLLLVLPALPLFWLARRSLPTFPALLLAWAYLVLPGIFSHATEWELKEAPLIALWDLAIDLPTSSYDVLLLNGGHAGLASTGVSIVQRI